VTGYQRGARTIAGRPGATGATGPAGPENERATLVEEVAVDALRRAEALEESLAAEAARFVAADELLFERDRDILAGVAERWCRDHLGDDRVWLGPYVMEYVARKRNAAYAAAYNANTIRTADWKASNHKRNKVPWVEYGEGLPPYVRMKWEDRPRDGMGWNSRADHETSLEAAASEIAAEAERTLIAWIVLREATAITRKYGFDFWEHSYIEVY
jgi:hypothetical protein